MSLLRWVSVVCASCSAEQDLEFAESVNVDRRPDLREAVLDGSFQAITCGNCGTAARLPPTLTYLDAGRKQWFLTLPTSDRAYWDSFEVGALDIFNDSFGASAPGKIRELGRALSVRVVFGWSGLREKLLCDRLGIADVELELLKLLLLRTIAAGGLTDSSALRLIGEGKEAMLPIAWIDDASEEVGDVFQVPRDLLDEIKADGAAWDVVRAEIASGPFVDVTKMLVETELPVAD